MASTIFTLPVRTVWGDPTKSLIDESFRDCTIEYDGLTWRVPASSVHDASPILQQLVKNTTEKKHLDLNIIASVKGANLENVTAVVRYIERSELTVHPVFGARSPPAITLKKCAEIYVLANHLQMPALATNALDILAETMNSCSFGSLTARKLKDLVQYTLSNTTRGDGGLRRAVIRFSAAYHQKYLNMHESVLTDNEVKENSSLALCKQLLRYQSQFSELNELLTRVEPQAWELAKDYEQQLQQLNDLQDR